jgi:hypothetical protein
MSDEPKVKISPGTRARCAWIVTAGVIPGTAEEEHTRQWVISSETFYQEDEMSDDEFTKAHPDGKSTFKEYCDEAFEYARSLHNPRYLNWVRVDWIWY